MPLNNSSLNKIFVYVPQAEVAAFKVGAGITAAYKNRISFLGGTGEIMTNGEIFAMNRDADITALETLLGTTSSTLASDLNIGDFDGATILAAIKYVYETADDNADALAGRLDIIEGTGEGSITKAVNDAIANLVNNAPDALDTLKEIADWISRDGADAANLITRMEDIEAQVAENEQVTAGALIDLQNQINDMTGGAGSIQQQITTAIDALDNSITLAGTTAAQPQNVGIDTQIDVLGSVTISETNGTIDNEAPGKSAKVVLHADAAGAARKAYDVLYGDVNTDTTDSMTLIGLRARIDDKSTTGTFSVSTNPAHTVEFTGESTYLVTGTNLADTLNSIEMWETYSAN